MCLYCDSIKKKECYDGHLRSWDFNYDNDKSNMEEMVLRAELALYFTDRYGKRENDWQ